jgi:hypothetical protein
MVLPQKADRHTIAGITEGCDLDHLDGKTVAHAPAFAELIDKVLIEPNGGPQSSSRQGTVVSHRPSPAQALEDRPVEFAGLFVDQVGVGQDDCGQSSAVHWEGVFGHLGIREAAGCQY